MIILGGAASRLGLRFSYVTGSRNHLLEGLLKYENSEIQRTVHSYKLDSDFERRVAQKKRGLPIASMLKKYDKKIMLREFLFEEPTSGEYVIPEAAGTTKDNQGQLMPNLLFGREALDKVFEEQVQAKELSFEEIGIEFKNRVAKKYGDNLRPKFVKYYETLGQQKKAMDLSEELEKVNNMTDEEFERFLSTVKS